MEGVSLQDPGIFYPFYPKTPDSVGHSLGKDFQGQKIQIIKAGSRPFDLLALSAANLYHERIQIPPDFPPPEGIQFEGGVRGELFFCGRRKKDFPRITENLFLPFARL